MNFIEATVFKEMSLLTAYEGVHVSKGLLALKHCKLIQGTEHKRIQLSNCL